MATLSYSAPLPLNETNGLWCHSEFIIWVTCAMLTCWVHCCPLTPLPGRGWTGLPCHLAENGGSGRKLLSDADGRMTPSGEGPVLQVRKPAWEGVPTEDLLGTINLRFMKTIVWRRLWSGRPGAQQESAEPASKDGTAQAFKAFSIIRVPISL